MYSARNAEDLDPRRRTRHARRRFHAASKMVAVPRLHELLATVLVRLGLVR